MHPSPFRFECGNTRRELFRQAGNGFFGTALAYLLAQDGRSALADPAVKSPHFPAKAKSCIFLFMVGGPSQFDTFDPKPELVKRHGQKHDFKGSNVTSQKPSGEVKGSPFAFSKLGQSGIEVSELFPHVASCVDDLAIIRSMTTDTAAHGTASLAMNTGYVRQGFPSLGSWATYGLGSVNENLPGFVVLVNGERRSRVRRTGALASCRRLTRARSSSRKAVPVDNLQSTQRRSRLASSGSGSTCCQPQRGPSHSAPQNTELAARIEAYELAYRMQSHAPEAVDLADEPRPREGDVRDRREGRPTSSACRA